MAKMPLIFLLLILAITAAKSYGSESIRGLDVNDVAILFHVDSDSRIHYPDIGLKSLVSRKVLEEQILPFSLKHDATPFGKVYDEWKVAALRYDPCAPDDVTAATHCHSQIRLVTQPGTDDTAMHLLFRMGDAGPVAGDPIVNDLRAIQQASRDENIETVGMPLSVHPALAKESRIGHGTVGALIQVFIRKYCSQKNLEEITFTSTEGGSQWHFFHGDFANGQWTPKPIHNIPNHGLVQSTDNNGNLFPVFKRSPIGLGSIIETDQRKNGALWNQLLLTVENPERSQSKRVDCASCHVSSKLIAHEFKTDFSSPESFVNPPGLTGFAEYSLQPNQFSDNLRNFAYNGREPTVSTITANSAAHVADLVNRSQGWENPSNKDCSAPEVRGCFSTEGKTAEVCLRLCKPRN